MADDDEGYFRINGKGAQLVFANNNGKVQTPIDPKSGLPMLTMFHNIDDAAEKLEIAMHSCAAAENNQNLSPSQKEMLRWHFRLGHASMSAIHYTHVSTRCLHMPTLLCSLLADNSAGIN